MKSCFTKIHIYKFNFAFFYLCLLFSPARILNNKTEPKIAIIPTNLISEKSSFQSKNPIIVATKGSTVTKIAAFPVSKPLSPIV